MGPNILSGLDRIRITQTRLFVKNFCIVVALIMIKACLLLDGLAYILHFISVVICFTYKEFAYLTLSSVFESNKAPFRTRGRNSPVSV